MLMAQVPLGATLIPNPLSPAPGFFISRMAVFPGVPRMLQAMFEWVKPMVSATPREPHHALRDGPGVVLRGES